MVYKKVTTIGIAIAIIAAFVSNFVFSAGFESSDKIYGSILSILIFIQKYSWPVITLVFIYALYKYYVIGSELLEHKMNGQKMIVGIALFMAILQCLPLIYAFMTIAS